MPLSLGVDIGGTKMYAGLYNSQGECVKSNRVPTPTTKNQADLQSALESLIKETCKDQTINVCGVSWPGMIANDGKTALNAVNATGVAEWNIGGLIEEWTGAPTIAENDANLMAYAEWKAGAGKGSTSCFGMIVGTGVGGGLVIANQHNSAGTILRGFNGEAGEIGLMHNLRPDPTNKDRIELLMVQDALAFSRDENNEPRPPAEVIQEQSDDYILWLNTLACHTANIIRCYNPEIIAFGGGVGLSLVDQSLPQLTTLVKEHLYDHPQVQFTLKTAIVNDPASALGAVHYANDTLMAQRH